MRLTSAMARLLLLSLAVFVASALHAGAQQQQQQQQQQQLQQQQVHPLNQAAGSDAHRAAAAGQSSFPFPPLPSPLNSAEAPDFPGLPEPEFGFPEAPFDAAADDDSDAFAVNAAGAPASGSAAPLLGAGVQLGQPSASSGSPLSLVASQQGLCPVVKYATAVEPLSDSEFAALKAASGSDGRYAQAAGDTAAAAAKAFRIVLTPLSFAHNASMPSIDWADVHFRVGNQPQQSLKMKHAAHSMSSAQASPSSSRLTFEPILMLPTETLSFGFTICVAMIDCNTDVHTFSPQAAEQQQQRLQMAAAADLAQKQQLEQQQQQLAAERQRLALSQAQAQQLAQSQAAASLLGMGAPQAAPLQAPTAAPAASALSAASPSLLQAPHTAGCPAVSYTYKIDCGDEECKASFINLSKDKPLDWVDVHFVQTDAAHLAALRSHIETSGAWRAQMLELAAVGSVPQLNFQMSLGAGAPPAMAMHSMAGAAGAAAPHQRGLLSMGELSSAAHLNRFGASSSPAALLSETGGQQVWQFPLPLRFKDGDMVGIGFTYCSAGTDCDTEASFYRLHEVDDSEKKQEKGRAQDDEQQTQLLRHAQAKAQLDSPLRLAGISQPRLSLSGAAAGRSPLIMSAHQRLQAALDSDFDLDADDRLSKEL